MRYHFHHLLKKFVEDSSGNIAMIFAMVLFPMIFLLGVTVDYGKGINRKQQLGYAMDVAALATAKADISIGKPALEDIANTYFYANLPDDIDPSEVSISVHFLDDNKNEVTNLAESTSVRIRSNMDVETVFMRIGNSKMDVDGVPQLNLDLDSAASRSLGYLEVALAMDNTGSMAWDSTNDIESETANPYSNSKIEQLKEAAKDLIKTLFDNQTTSEYVRIGLVPFTREVLSDNTKNNGDWKVTGDYICRVGEQKEPWTQGPWSPSPTCPNTEMLGLTHKRGKLFNRLNQMIAHSGTNATAGMYWGFEMVKSGHKEFPGKTKPEGWDSEKARKAVILLSDGANSDSSWNADTLAKCTEAKNGGVIVYTIAFKINDATAVQMLDDCSTDPAPGSTVKYHFSANNPTELQDAFKKISKGLEALKLIN